MRPANSSEKAGPYTASEIRQLAQDGIIQPLTGIENEIGGMGFQAGKISGIVFGEPALVNVEEKEQKLPSIPVPPEYDPVPIQPEIDTSKTPATEAYWYYYDANGIKQGPIDYKKLKILALHGIITKDTLLETEEGNLIPANEDTNWRSFQEKLVKLPPAQAVTPKATPQIQAVMRGVLALVVFFIGVPAIILLLMVAACSVK